VSCTLGGFYYTTPRERRKGGGGESTVRFVFGPGLSNSSKGKVMGSFWDISALEKVRNGKRAAATLLTSTITQKRKLGFHRPSQGLRVHGEEEKKTGNQKLLCAQAGEGGPNFAVRIPSSGLSGKCYRYVGDLQRVFRRAQKKPMQTRKPAHMSTNST